MNIFLFLFFLLGAAGCATKQLSSPVIIPSVVAPHVAPVPAAVVTPVTPTPQTVVSLDPSLSQSIIQEQGQMVEVTSSPPGARIEMNEKLLGTAPGKFYVLRKPNRYGFLPRMTITATPPEPVKGQYVQTKVFDGYTETPDKINFNMSSLPPLPRIEGN